MCAVRVWFIGTECQNTCHALNGMNTPHQIKCRFDLCIYFHDFKHMSDLFSNKIILISSSYLRPGLLGPWIMTNMLFLTQHQVAHADFEVRKLLLMFSLKKQA